MAIFFIELEEAIFLYLRCSLCMTQPCFVTFRTARARVFDNVQL